MTAEILKRIRFLIVFGSQVAIILLLNGCAAGQALPPSKSVRVSILEVSRQVPVPAEPLPARITAQASQQAKEQVSAQGHQVMVVATPSGATIAVNGKVIGVAPGKFSVIRNPNRYGFLPRMVITATPLPGAKGEYMQSKLFNGYTETPDLIVFDMAKLQPVPRIEGE